MTSPSQARYGPQASAAPPGAETGGAAGPESRGAVINGRGSGRHGRHRVVALAITVIVLLTLLAACAGTVSAATSPSPSPDAGRVEAPAAAEESRGRDTKVYALGIVVAFVGATIVVLLKRRGGGRAGDE